MSVSDSISELDFVSSDEEVSSFKRSNRSNVEEESKPGPSHDEPESEGNDTAKSKDDEKDGSQSLVNILPMHRLEHTLEKLVSKKLEKILSQDKAKAKKRKNDFSEERDRKSKKMCSSDGSLSSNHADSSSDSVSDSDDEIFIIKDDDEIGKSLKDSTKKFLQKRFKNTVKRECFMKLLRKYKTPRNAPFIKAQKTNKEVWGKLKHFSKSNDNYLTNIQRNISKAAIAFAKASESKKKNSKDLLQDGLTILGQTHKQVANLRRSMQKAVLPYNIKRACDQEEEDNDLLFGQDLAKRIKESKEYNTEESRKRQVFLERRRTFHNTKQNQNFRHKKYNYNNNNNFNSNSNNSKVKFQNRK